MRKAFAWTTLAMFAGTAASLGWAMWGGAPTTALKLAGTFTLLTLMAVMAHEVTDA